MSTARASCAGLQPPAGQDRNRAQERHARAIQRQPGQFPQEHPEVDHEKYGQYEMSNVLATPGPRRAKRKNRRDSNRSGSVREDQADGINGMDGMVCRTIQDRTCCRKMRTLERILRSAALTHLFDSTPRVY